MTTSASDKTVVLVTGGTGLVGQAIKAILKEVLEGHKNEEWVFLGSKHGDLREVVETNAIFEQYRTTYVIHLAAIVGGVLMNSLNNGKNYFENSAINRNVLEASRIFEVKKVVSIISTCVFPDKITYPLEVSELHNGPPHPSNFGYSYAKRMIDIMNKACAQQYGCNFVSVCSTNIYGPHDNFSVANGHVIPGLIHKMYKAKMNNTPLTMWGTGAPRRQFVYSQDVARLIVWALRNYEERESIFLTVDEKDEVSIKELTDIIKDAFDFEGEILYDATKPDGQYKKTASNDKLRSYLPNFRFTPLEEGIKNTVNWFVNNYEKARM